ncbi:hypothetical protein LIER_02278 [Lithospermum erythrorhizon]|uniref:TRF2/HOY1 PH-like domain-containing protein n=1 Tax=Lithospermum erythrorhizon TaxID=34254 RepID=A0AAV3NQE4_LITER
MHFMSEQPRSLGLSLKKTPSLVNLIECELYQTKKKKHVDDSTSPVPILSEKLKASNFRAYLLKIGDWEVISQHDGNIVAKCYYAKRKLVWEILEGPLKSKIELQWSNIVGIRATILDNQPSILEIELNEPPLFYRETAPQPKKHTLWQQSHDFTGGQASKCRRHYVRFPTGALDKTYENILLCDPRLYDLSRSPFPSQQSPYFDPYMYGSSQFFEKETVSVHQPQGAQCQYQNYPATLVPPNLQKFKIENQQHYATLDSNSSPMSVMNFNRVNDQANNYTFTQFGDKLCNQAHVEDNDVLQVLPNQEINVLNYDGRIEAKEVLKEIENHFLGQGESELSNAYDQHILFSMDSLFEPLEGVNNIDSHAYMKNNQEDIVGNVMLPQPSPGQQSPPILWWSPPQNLPLQPALYHQQNQDFSRDERNHEGVQYWGTMMSKQMSTEDWNNTMANY